MKYQLKYTVTVSLKKERARTEGSGVDNGRVASAMITLPQKMMINSGQNVTNYLKTLERGQKQDLVEIFVYTHVHRIRIHKSQKVEATQVSMYR